MDLIQVQQRARIAQSASAILGMPTFCDAVDAEVSAIAAINPSLPHTERANRVLWALVFSQLSQSALTQSTEQQTKNHAAV